MDKVDYLEEANRQLMDERFYKKLDSDPTEEFSTKITQELKIMKENSHIDKNTFDYLKPVKPKAGRFYLLPKIHKVTKPGRSIVSANGPSIPSLCGMLVYNDVTSIGTRVVPEESFEDNQWFLSNVRVVLLHEVEGGNRRIRRVK
jgi:hypothetical protein